MLGNIDVSIQFSDDYAILNTLCLAGQVKIPRRRVYDFHRSWRFCRKQLNQHFDKLNWEEVLLGATLDNLPSILNALVLGAWDAEGISKWINDKSRPWFCAELKQIRQECRSLKRRYKACVRSGGTSHRNSEDYKKRLEDMLDKYFSTLKRLRADCDVYISKLLDANLHTNVDLFS